MATIEAPIVQNPAVEAIAKGAEALLALKAAAIKAEAEAAEARARQRALDEAADAFERALDALDHDQMVRLKLEEAIQRYERQCSAVESDSVALWLSTAAKAAGCAIKRIEVRQIEQRSPCDGVVGAVYPDRLYILPDNGKAAVALPVLDGKVTVESGERVQVGTRVVVAPEAVTHVIAKGPFFDPLIVGWVKKDERGALEGVLVEGRSAKKGLFTLLATGIAARFPFGGPCRGFERLTKLVGSPIELAAPVPAADLRAAADAAYGPCPQLPPRPAKA